MDGERISLRLETEDLEMIDEFIRSRADYSNRSQLVRVALREFVSRDAEPAEREEGLNIRLPGRIEAALENMKDAGFYTSIEEVIVDLIRRELFSGETFQKAKDEAMRSPVDLLDRPSR